MTESRPASPCLKVCVDDDVTRSCLGCRRTLGEIARWGRMTAVEQWQVMARVRCRKVASPRAAAS